MSNIIRFPVGRPVPAAPIPREQFERLAGLALDVVDQIVALLDDANGNTGSAQEGRAVRPWSEEDASP
jgi:hypothetical protein